MNLKTLPLDPDFEVQKSIPNYVTSTTSGYNSDEFVQILRSNISQYNNMYMVSFIYSDFSYELNSYFSPDIINIYLVDNNGKKVYPNIIEGEEIHFSKINIDNSSSYYAFTAYFNKSRLKNKSYFIHYEFYDENGNLTNSSKENIFENKGNKYSDIPILTTNKLSKNSFMITLYILLGFLIFLLLLFFVFWYLKKRKLIV